jgi:hypothetical protein
MMMPFFGRSWQCDTNIGIRMLLKLLSRHLFQLEGLVSSLEDSILSTEKAFDGTPKSPNAAAKINLERERRHKLLSKITKIISADAERNADASMVGCGSSRGEDIGESIAKSDSSSEWKHKTLLRLHKFLRKQYRLRKSRSLLRVVSVAYSLHVALFAVCSALS